MTNTMKDTAGRTAWRWGEPADYIEHVAIEGARFADVVERGELAAPVAACPGWDLADLVQHLGEIHLWAAANVAFPAADWLSVDHVSDLAPYWPDLAYRPEHDDLVAWYRATLANLIRVLQASPPDVEAFSFVNAPTPLTMWSRRQASEIAIHRFDAELACRLPSAYDPHFAADMLDELIAGLALHSRGPAPDGGRVLHVHAHDVDEHWWVTIDRDLIHTSRQGADADLTIAGTAAELYLTLWNRTPDSSVERRGDRTVMHLWRDRCRIRWGR